MALLIDYSQIAISNLMQNIREVGDESIVDGDFLRHMILNSIRMYNQRYAEKYGKPVICVDSRKYWRREIFPEYKAARKAGRDKLDIDWELVYSTINEVKIAMRDFFGYKVIEVEGAEADDVIGVLAKYKHKEEPVMIISSDSDFKQLQRYRGVKQYSPTEKKTVSCDAPVSYLKEKVIRGDKKDGIPNILTPSNFFVAKEEGSRQKSIMKKKLDVWMAQKPEQFCESVEMKERLELNEKLIDLNFTPDDISDSILNEYEKQPKKDAMGMLNYMKMNKMRQLISSIEEF